MKFFHKTACLVALFTCFSISFSGCADESFVYQRSVSELNQKAAKLMQQGDYAGAVGRLESAHDLMPKESSILFNLAIAYKENEELDKSIASFEKFIKNHETDKRLNDAVLSLAIVLEAKADGLVDKAIEAEEQTENKAENRLLKEGFIEESISNYERAEKAYRLALAKLSSSQDKIKSAEEIQSQIDSVNESISNLKAGDLDKVTLY